MNPFEEYLEKLEVDLSTPWANLSYKFNTELDNPDLHLLSYIKSRIKDEKIPFFVAIGIHSQGKSSEKHCHISVVLPTNNYVKSKNDSRDRKKYYEESEVELEVKTSLKIGSISDVEAFEKCLKYPWKEGKIVNINTPFYERHYNIYKIPIAVESYLKESAIGLFQSKLQRERLKNRSDERASNIQNELLTILGERTFDDYSSYKHYIYTEYYKGLEIENYPDHNILQKNVQKVAIFRKIIPPYYFDKN